MRQKGCGKNCHECTNSELGIREAERIATNARIGHVARRYLERNATNARIANWAKGMRKEMPLMHEY